MTVLRLTALSWGRVDAALMAVDRVVLARRDHAAYADVAAVTLAPFVRALALAGVRAEPCAADLAAPPGALFARGRDLVPLPAGALALDLVRLERVPLGRATRELLRPRWSGILRPGDDARERCRQLLRCQRVTFEWSRTAWGARGALRSAQGRRSLRPALFAPASEDPARRRISTDDERIGAWLFG